MVDTSQVNTETPPEVSEPTAVEIKEQGNQCVRNENYMEAILHYSHVIKMIPNDPILYSNRSFAFLKIKQLYYANEDAEKAIQLKPDWAKGYFRRAEVQTAAGQYDTALLSYGRAIQLQPNDISIINAAKKVAALSKTDTMHEKRFPYVCAAIGIAVGVIIIIFDQVLTKKPSVNNPALMVLLIVAISLLGLGGAKLYRYFIKLQRKGLLDPPIDLLEDFKKEKEPVDENTESYSNRTRYSKAQARQRFRKGKS